MDILFFEQQDCSRLGWGPLLNSAGPANTQEVLGTLPGRQGDREPRFKTLPHPDTGNTQLIEKKCVGFFSSASSPTRTLRNEESSGNDRNPKTFSTFKPVPSMVWMDHSSSIPPSLIRELSITMDPTSVLQP